MKVLRHIAAVVLLLVLPFQAALGASAVACPHAAQSSDGTRAAPEIHGGPTLDRATPGTIAGTLSSEHAHHLPAIAGPDVHQPAAGPCGVCGTCCVGEVAIFTDLPIAGTAGAELRVTANVDDAKGSGVADDLFRPPRTTTL